MSNKIIHIVFNDKTEIIHQQENSKVIVVNNQNRVLQSDISHDYTEYLSFGRYGKSLNKKLIFGKEIMQKFYIAPSISEYASVNKSYMPNFSKKLSIYDKKSF